MRQEILTVEKIERRVDQIIKKVDLLKPGESSDDHFDYLVKVLPWLCETEVKAYFLGLHFASKTFHTDSEGRPDGTLLLKVEGVTGISESVSVVARRRDLKEEFKISFTNGQNYGDIVEGEFWDREPQEDTLRRVAKTLKIK